MRYVITTGLLVLVLALAACNLPGAVDAPTLEPTPGGGEQPTTGPTTDPGGQPTAEQPTQPPATDPGEEPAATEPPASGVENCPLPGEDQEQYIDEEAGYCFLYPSIFEVNTNFSMFEHQVALIGPPLDPTSMEPVLVTMQIDMTGPAVYVSTSQEYAQMWVDVTVPGMGLEVAGAEIGGQPAAVVEGIPGRIAGRAGFVVVDGVKYTVLMHPSPEDFAELTEQAEMLWDVVTGSILFFEPDGLEDVVLAEDVCAEPGNGMNQRISLLEGYCYLYPEEFEADPDFAGGVTAGPTVEVPNFGPMRARLVLAWAGSAEGKSPREIIEPWIETGVDPATVQDTTIGGAPAVMYIDPRGPVLQIGAHIVADDQVYTIVGNPYDHTLYPEQAELIDRMWESMTGTVAFFDPWR